MQTFLPVQSFTKTAKILDNKRLGKQRVECLQILKSLAGESAGWRNHPAVKMWQGSEQYLIAYGLAICKEWIRRGFKDTCFEKINSYRNRFKTSFKPAFLGNSAFHLSHQSNLLRKDANYYSKFFSGSPDLPYVWLLTKNE